MMWSRCRNINYTDYHNYGGRGITVCDRWLEFEQFLADMGERPLGTPIDRINNDGNYKPGNCRWANRSVQNKNKRHYGQVGVVWAKHANKFRAQIGSRGTYQHLGYFNTYEEAVIARQAAERACT